MGHILYVDFSFENGFVLSRQRPKQRPHGSSRNSTGKNNVLFWHTIVCQMNVSSFGLNLVNWPELHTTRVILVNVLFLHMY